VLFGSKNGYFCFRSLILLKKEVFGGLELEIKVLESGVFLGIICGCS
jgi:hypothetical protein